MNRKYTTEECLQEYYNSLEKQIKEKDAIIYWFAEKLTSLYPNLTSKESWIEHAKESINKQNEKM